MNRFVSFFAAAAAAIGLAACGGNNTTPAPLPTLGPTCTLPSGTQSVLVYPAPGASGVADGNGQIVIGSTTALPVGQPGQNWEIMYADAVTGGHIVSLSGTALASTVPPFPAPSATPAFPNPQYQQQTGGTGFLANQVVTVFLNNTASNCAPLQLGQFTT